MHSFIWWNGHSECLFHSINRTKHTSYPHFLFFPFLSHIPNVLHVYVRLKSWNLKTIFVIGKQGTVAVTKPICLFWQRCCVCICHLWQREILYLKGENETRYFTKKGKWNKIFSCPHPYNPYNIQSPAQEYI